MSFPASVKSKSFWKRQVSCKKNREIKLSQAKCALVLSVMKLPMAKKVKSMSCLVKDA